MRILYIISSLQPLGPVIIVHNLVKEIMRMGHQCTVFYFDESVSLPFPCAVRRIAFARKTNLGNYDVVHSHGIRPNLYASLHKPFHTRTRFITTVHSYILEEFKCSYGWILGCICSRLFFLSIWRHDQVVVLSRDAIDYYARFVSRKKLAYCYNGVDIDNTESLTEEERMIVERFKGQRVLIGICSSLVRIKGIDVLIRVMQYLPDRYRLLIVGDGDCRAKLEQWCMVNCLADRILFLGFKNNAYRFLPLIDIYVQTSWSEGFCLALTEAALYGKRIVCSDIPGMREKYTEKEVVYFQMPDVQELARAILRVESDVQIGSFARERAVQVFTAYHMAKQYMEIYRQ